MVGRRFMEDVQRKLRSFFSSPSKIIILCLSLTAALLSLLLSLFHGLAADKAGKKAGAQASQGALFFFLPGCHDCSQQEEVLHELAAEDGNFSFQALDASLPANAALYKRLSAEAGLAPENMGIPTTFIGKTALVGLWSIKEYRQGALEGLPHAARENPELSQATEPSARAGLAGLKIRLPLLGGLDLQSLSLPALTIVLALADGFNPCAMWVLVFMIGLIAGLGDKRKIWIIVGSFVLASGILYYLFMTAWLNVFIFTGSLRIVSVLIGAFSLGFGGLGIQEIISSKGHIACALGDGKRRESLMEKIRATISKPISLGLVAAVIVLAFIVNSIEFACSAAIPAVYTKVLSQTGLSIPLYYLYLAIYVLFFMLDDLIVFSLAAFSLGSFSGTKAVLVSKAAGSVAMLALGLLLLFFPHLIGA